jgi:hypothetical protein
VRKVDFDRANRKELSASLEQELSHCGVLVDLTLLRRVIRVGNVVVPNHVGSRTLK